jgi:hypothetical protein
MVGALMVGALMVGALMGILLYYIIKYMFSFIVPTCIRDEIQLNQFKRCIESIRNHHQQNKIIIINDSPTEEYDYVFKEIQQKYNNVFIEKTIIKGSGEQQIFKVFLEKDDADIAFFMHDSMLLNRPLDNIDNINGVKFVWHFTNHIIEWDNIYEEQTEFNIKNNIKTHSDLIRYQLIDNYNDNKDFLNFALYYLSNKAKWCGCFGNCCIIDRKSLLAMNERVGFVDKFINTIAKRERCANESIFGLICHYIFPEINFHNSYDGLYYDGITVNHYSHTPTGFDNLNWVCKSHYISKISFGR